MVIRTTRVTILLVVAFLAVSVSGQKKPQATASRDIVIFAVEKYEAGDAIIEPVLIRRGNRYLPPPSGEVGEDASNKFIAEYLKNGTRYRMLSGGGEAGWVTVKERLEPGCVDLQASVTINTIESLNEGELALATTSDSLGSKQALRRAPNDEERAAIVKMAQRLFRQKGVAASLVKQMKTTRLAAVDLNHDSMFELIGTFDIAKDENAYSLFIIAEPEVLSYRAAFTLYKKSVSDADIEGEQLVDALDLDGDGIMEVIARHLYYESHNFVVYKKLKGQWRNIYRGGGGGC